MCILTEGRDQKNVKPLTSINVFLLERFLKEALYGKRKEEHKILRIYSTKALLSFQPLIIKHYVLLCLWMNSQWPKKGELASVD